MPIWVIILLISLCVTTVTGVYTLRQNGRNGHRNGNGNGPTLSQMIKESDQSSSEGPPVAGQKYSVMPVPQSILPEEETATPSEESKHRKKPQHPLPDEEPHDPPDSHDDPPSAIREPRRFRIRSREEEIDGDELTPEMMKNALLETAALVRPTQDAFIAVLSFIEEQGKEIEDLQRAVAKITADQGIQVQPDMRDEETQSSVVRKEKATQAMSSTQDMGTGEWLILQQSIGVGNAIETEEKALQVTAQKRDQSLQTSPDHHSIGIGSETIPPYDQGVQISPPVMDEEIQQDISRHTISIQGDSPILVDQGVQVTPDRKEEQTQTMGTGQWLHHQAVQADIVRQHKEVGSHDMRRWDKSLQRDPDLDHKALQINVSRRSVGLQGEEMFTREQEIQYRPLMRSFWEPEDSDREENSFIVQSMTPPLSPHLPSWLKEIKLEESLILDSPQSVLGRQRSFHLSDLPLDESQGDSPESLRKSRSKSWVVFDSDEEWSMIHSRSSIRTVKSEEMEEHLR